jgi:signal transduction histidine kinase/CheY-like chemotaxis protein
MMGLLKKHKASERNHPIHLVMMGLFFSLFYWIMESVRDVISFSRGNLIERLVPAEPANLSMRLLVVCSIMGFGLLAHWIRFRIEIYRKKINRNFLMSHLFWAGIGFSVLYWILETVRETWSSDQKFLISALVNPDLMHTGMRLMAICVILLFATYVHLIMDDRRRAERELRQMNEQMELLVDERTKALSTFNIQLEQEITERIRTEEKLIRINSTLNMLSECHELLLRIQEEKQLLNDVCHKVVEIEKFPMVWVDFQMQPEQPALECHAQAVLHPEDLEILAWFYTNETNPVHQAIRSQKPFISANLPSHFSDENKCQRLQEQRYTLFASFPMIVNRHLLGTLNIVGREDQRFGEEEMTLYNELAIDLAFGLDVLKMKHEQENTQREKEHVRRQLIQSQKLEAIGILAGGVAHDFNNMLTAIQVSTDLAMMEMDEKSPVCRELNEIHQISMRGADLARQLLLFSQKHPIETQPLDLSATVKQLHKMFTRILSSEIKITNEYDLNSWKVSADRGTIEQVIVNLVVNAQEAMPDGGELKLITENVVIEEEQCKQIPESRPGRFVRVTVADTGVGMTEEMLQRIFEPFFSTKAPGKGAGLGLSVAYGIVKEHQGFLQIQSEQGQGTVCQVYLPVLDVPDRQKVKRIPFDAYQGEGKGILMVEDEEKVREFTCKGLQMNGYDVFTASTGTEAEALFDKEAEMIDIIFSDVVLPDINGIALSERLKKKKSSLKVLLCSGYVDDLGRPSSLTETIYLQKPYTLGDVLEKLQRLMEA